VYDVSTWNIFFFCGAEFVYTVYRWYIFYIAWSNVTIDV
jgi:hypothetical protein